MTFKLFNIVNYDGWNIGVAGSFTESYIELDSFKECVDLAWHWEMWVLHG